LIWQKLWQKEHLSDKIANTFMVSCDYTLSGSPEAPIAGAMRSPQRFIPEKRTASFGSVNLGDSKLLTREEEVTLFGELNLGRQAQTAMLVCNGLRSFLGYEPVEVPEIKQMIDDGQWAKNRIVMSNTLLVLSRARAKKFQNRGLELSDMFQEGIFGLYRAIDKFDPTLGFKFSTLACICIDNAIERSIADTSRTIRIPYYASRAARLVAGKRNELWQLNGVEPTSAQIGDALAMQPCDITKYDLLRTINGTISLDASFGPGGDEDKRLVGDYVGDRTTAGPEETAINKVPVIDKDRLYELAGLKSREIEMIELRYGINENGQVHTLEEVGTKYGLTKERIRQIVKDAMCKLEKALQKYHEELIP